MPKRVCLIAFSLALLAGPAAEATTYLVNPDGTGDFPTIQAAIDASVDGDVIELSDGTFQGDGNRDVSYLGKAVTVRSQSGSPETCVIDCGGDSLQDHQAFSFTSGEDAGSVLQAATITNGGNTDSAVLFANGGAPKVIDCRFIDNAAGGGGAVTCRDGSNPSLIGCVFSANSAEHIGGAVYCRDSAPEFTGCEFRDNSSGPYGGAVGCNQASPNFTECIFEGNSAMHVGGAILCEIDCAPIMTDCVFTDNTVGVFGGGLALEASCFATLTGCLFSGNSAETGGGLFCWLSSATVIECTFYGNSAIPIHGGGISCWPGSTLEIENTIVASSDRGVGVHCGDGSSAALACCDVYGNAHGDWVGCLADQSGVNGNIEEDPLFCDPGTDDFSLRSDSPCLPGNHPDEDDCGLMGAFPVGCPVSSVSEPETVLSKSWGQLKSEYR